MMIYSGDSGWGPQMVRDRARGSRAHSGEDWPVGTRLKLGQGSLPGDGPRCAHSMLGTGSAQDGDWEVLVLRKPEPAGASAPHPPLTPASSLGACFRLSADSVSPHGCLCSPSSFPKENRDNDIFFLK